MPGAHCLTAQIKPKRVVYFARLGLPQHWYAGDVHSPVTALGTQSLPDLFFCPSLGREAVATPPGAPFLSLLSSIKLASLPHTRICHCPHIDALIFPFTQISPDVLIQTPQQFHIPPEGSTMEDVEGQAFAADNGEQNIYEFFYKGLFGIIGLRFMHILILYLSSFALHTFICRMLLLRNKTTLLAAVGASLNFIYWPAERIQSIIVPQDEWYNEWSCAHKIEMWMSMITTVATTLMLYHLFFKAHGVMNKMPERSWTKLEIANALFIPSVPIIGFFHIWSVESAFLDSAPGWAKECRNVPNIYLLVAYYVVVIVANVMSAVLFLDGLLTLLTGGIVERPPLERAKVVMRLIIKGVGGLKHLPKDAHIIRTSIGTVNSYSSHVSIKEKQISAHRRCEACLHRPLRRRPARHHPHHAVVCG